MKTVLTLHFWYHSSGLLFIITVIIIYSICQLQSLLSLISANSQLKNPAEINWRKKSWSGRQIGNKWMRELIFEWMPPSFLHSCFVMRQDWCRNPAAAKFIHLSSNQLSFRKFNYLAGVRWVIGWLKENWTSVSVQFPLPREKERSKARQQTISANKRNKELNILVAAPFFQPLLVWLLFEFKQENQLKSMPRFQFSRNFHSLC